MKYKVGIVWNENQIFMSLRFGAMVRDSKLVDRVDINAIKTVVKKGNQAMCSPY